MKMTTKMIDAAALSIAAAQIRLANAESNDEMLQAVSRSVLTSWIEMLIESSADDYVRDRITDVLLRKEC